MLEELHPPTFQVASNETKLNQIRLEMSQFSLPIQSTDELITRDVSSLTDKLGEYSEVRAKCFSKMTCPIFESAPPPGAYSQKLGEQWFLH
jgi:hypothetical protein